MMPIASEQGENMQMKTPLELYVGAFERLTADSLISELKPLFSEQVYFKDPFNECHTREATMQVFRHMFETLIEPRFLVEEVVSNKHVAYLKWRFKFQIKASKPLELVGMSRVEFDEDGLVYQHVDYWDAGEAVYAKVPILKIFIRWIQHKLSAS